MSAALAIVCFAAMALAGCGNATTDGEPPPAREGRGEATAARSTPEPAPPPAVPTPAPTVPVEPAPALVAPPPPAAGCVIDPANTGRGRFAGTARVQLRGEDLDVDVADAPAICAQAGQGALFETCIAAGRVQIRADERRDGPQTLRGIGGRGASVLFARAGGASHVMAPGAEGSEIELGRDGRTARAHVTLRAILTGQTVEADLLFDCGGT